MKRTYYTAVVVLSSFLLSACGGTAEAVPAAEESAPAQVKEVEEAAHEPEVAEEPEDADVPEEPEVETLALNLYYYHDVLQPDSTPRLLIEYQKTDDYCAFGSGYLFAEDESSHPFYDVMVDPEKEGYHQERIEGDAGAKIKEPFLKMYTEYMQSSEPLFEELYQQLAQQFVDKKLKDYSEIFSDMEKIDVTDKMPDEMIFAAGDSGTIELPVVSVKVKGEGYTIRSHDTDFYGVPTWDDGENKRALNSIRIDFYIPKESLEELMAYNTELYDKATGAANDGSAAGEVAGEPADGADSGKNFDNVTGVEGNWYNSATGALTLVLYSNGKGIEYMDDGEAMSITYGVSYGDVVITNAYGMDYYTLTGPNSMVADPPALVRR